MVVPQSLGGRTMKKYVIGRVKVKTGLREEYLKQSSAYIAASRAEPGCLYYDEGLDREDPDGLIVIECWETPEAHANHTKAPHFAAFGPVFGKYVASAHFEEMNVGDVNDVRIGG
jgi:quinol monooxygenase YgiN